MNAYIRRVIEKRQRGEHGFTLIELLVVVVIIGILAAIAIPAFLRQRERAWGAQVQSALRNAATAAEAYSVDNGGSYAGLESPLWTNATPPVVATNWAAGGVTATPDVTITFVPRASDTEFELVGVHANMGTTTWTYDSTTGVIERNP